MLHKLHQFVHTLVQVMHTRTIFFLFFHFSPSTSFPNYCPVQCPKLNQAKRKGSERKGKPPCIFHKHCSSPTITVLHKGMLSCYEIACLQRGQLPCSPIITCEHQPSTNYIIIHNNQLLNFSDYLKEKTIILHHYFTFYNIN